MESLVQLSSSSAHGKEHVCGGRRKHYPNGYHDVEKFDVKVIFQLETNHDLSDKF